MVMAVGGCCISCCDGLKKNNEALFCHKQHHGCFKKLDLVISVDKQALMTQ